MLVIAALIVFTLSVYLSSAQDPQFPSPWQMAPVLEEFSPEPSQKSSSFSGSQRCVLEQYERIECGEPDISSDECEAISCCYDAQGCYYAKAGERWLKNYKSH